MRECGGVMLHDHCYRVRTSAALQSLPAGRHFGGAQKRRHDTASGSSQECVQNAIVFARARARASGRGCYAQSVAKAASCTASECMCRRNGGGIFILLLVYPFAQSSINV